MHRREFLRYSSAFGIYWALNSFLPSCNQSHFKSALNKRFFQGWRVIDAHAHPDQFHHAWPREVDRSSTLDKIKAVGMAASVFAAVGDLSFLMNSHIDYYTSTKNQLDWVQRLVKKNKVKLISKASDVQLVTGTDYIPGAIIAIEGGDPLEGKVERLDEFFRSGVRIITLVHYRNNELGDTMARYLWRNLDPGPFNNGLTRAGRKVIERMQELGMVIDVAHAHSKTLKDIVEMNPLPLLDSHTNPCPVEDIDRCWRLRTWKDIELIAKTGGLICTWPARIDKPPYRRKTILDWAREILEMKNRIGIEHVGLGTDGGGNVSLLDGYYDICDLTKLADTMETIGLSSSDIKAYMGENFYRVLKKCIG